MVVLTFRMDVKKKKPLDGKLRIMVGLEDEVVVGHGC